MSYPYKTIGASAAGVATILAVGTLLWWQRTPRPDMPRPQDEAETMTAVPERHAAMGRTTNYLHTIPANVSIWTTNKIEMHASSSIQLAPYQIVYGSSTNAYCGFLETDAITMSSASPAIGYIVSRLNPGSSRPDLTLYHYTNQYWRTDIMNPLLGGNYFWMSTGSDSLPVTLYPRKYQSPTFYATNAPSMPAATHGVITLAMAQTTTNVYHTNAVAAVWTNTVGMFPNATFQFPAGIRSAMSYCVATNCYGQSIRHDWLLPTNTYFSGETVDLLKYVGWPVNRVDRSIRQYPDEPYYYYWYNMEPDGNIPGLDDSDLWRNGDILYLREGAPQWWTNWVTLSTAHRITQTNYWDGIVISWSNGVAVTNYYTPQETGSSVTNPSTYAGHRSATNYTYTYQTNCWTNKSFAFERDGDPYTWSTNSYNDLARPLSIMQWQKSGVWWQSPLTNYNFSFLQGIAIPYPGGGLPTNSASFDIGQWNTNAPPILTEGTIDSDWDGNFTTNPPSTSGNFRPRAYIRYTCDWVPAWTDTSVSPNVTRPEIYEFSVQAFVSRSRLVFTPPNNIFNYTNGCFLIDTAVSTNTHGWSYTLHDQPTWPESPGIPYDPWLNALQGQTWDELVAYIYTPGHTYRTIAPSNFTITATFTTNAPVYTVGASVTSEWVIAYDPPLPSSNWMQQTFLDFVDDVFEKTEIEGHNCGTLNPYKPENNRGRSFVYWWGWFPETPEPYRNNPPYFDYNRAGWCVARPIFQSLTNYTNHAPAR